MARRYGLPVRVVLAADGSPRGFVWHGATYDVAEVLSRWHLQDRWWDARRHSDRQYFRVLCPDHQVFDLYFDQPLRLPRLVLSGANGKT